MILGQGTKIPEATQCEKEKKNLGKNHSEGKKKKSIGHKDGHGAYRWTVSEILIPFSCMGKDFPFSFRSQYLDPYVIPAL